MKQIACNEDFMLHRGAKLIKVNYILVVPGTAFDLNLWITWTVVKSVLFNWLGPISHDIIILTLLTTIQAIHTKFGNLNFNF